MVSCTYQNQNSEEAEEIPSLVQLHNDDKCRSINGIEQQSAMQWTLKSFKNLTVYRQVGFVELAFKY